MNQGNIALLERRRNRAIAIVLGCKEREIDPFLTPDQSNRLRKVVLDQFNDYHETVLDVMRSIEGEDGFNQLYTDMLREIHRAVVEEVEPDG